MPNTPAAKKTLRQDKKKAVQNKNKRRQMREAIKDFETAIEEGNTEKAEEIFPDVQKKIDKAAKDNLIHKNKAGRLKSRLNKKLEN